MFVTPLPIVAVVRLQHPKNALSPMLVTPLPIVTEVRRLHPRNALFPMLVTLLGMVTLVIASWSAKPVMLLTGSPPKVEGMTNAPPEPV
jgi:hypothetical protein